jgi:PTS system N-acetylglucosamine-specific IIC component
MTAATVDTPRRGVPGLAQLQRIGRSLMLPIASLPAAALLLRLGQPDMLGADGLSAHASWLQPVADVLAAAGNALVGNLPILFALGVAVGYARKSDGSTALAALIGYLVFKGVGDALSPYILGEPDAVTAGGVLGSADPAALDAAGTGDYNALVTHAITQALGAPGQELINYGVLGGIVIGLVTALLYQRFYRIKLPAYLAFFGGRRFVPIVTAGMAVLIAVVGALIYPAFDAGFSAVGEWVTGSTVVGGFVFGTLNRLLVPFGLHHLLNSLPWFQFGEYTDANGAVWNGDIARFLHGDPTAGTFMTGFFPIMMFAPRRWPSCTPPSRRTARRSPRSWAPPRWSPSSPASPSRSSSPSSTWPIRCTRSTRCSPAPRWPWSTPWASGTASDSPPGRSTTC